MSCTSLTVWLFLFGMFMEYDTFLLLTHFLTQISLTSDDSVDQLLREEFIFFCMTETQDEGKIILSILAMGGKFAWFLFIRFETNTITLLKLQGRGRSTWLWIFMTIGHYLNGINIASCVHYVALEDTHKLYVILLDIMCRPRHVNFM